jgi:ubiquinone/menaquinone biosynthesis C-methylase UbiE
MVVYFNLYKQDYNIVYGIDVGEKAINIGKRKYKEILNNLQFYNGKNLPFEKEKFDVILMFDIIEHISNVGRYLKKEVFRVLKNGGVLIF